MEFSTKILELCAKAEKALESHFQRIDAISFENTKKIMKVFEKFYNHVPSMNYKFLQYYSL